MEYIELNYRKPKQQFFKKGDMVFDSITGQIGEINSPDYDDGWYWVRFNSGHRLCHGRHGLSRVNNNGIH